MLIILIEVGQGHERSGNLALQPEWWRLNTPLPAQQRVQPDLMEYPGKQRYKEAYFSIFV